MSDTCASLLPRASLRRNFGWAFVGNLAYQLCQWLMLVVLAKLTTVSAVGEFGLAVAICTPITILAGLSLSGVQVSDARNEYSFGHYLSLRLISASVSLATIAVIAIVSGYSLSTAVLIVIVGLGQTVLIVREIFLTYMQKHERMDLVAVSNMIQGPLSLIALAMLIWATGSLLAAVVGLLVVRLVTWVAWDIPSVSRLVRRHNLGDAKSIMRPRWQWSRIGRLAWLAAPLGLAGGLLSLNSNIPRYFIERSLGKEALGYFVAVMALPMAGAVVVGAAGSSASPRLARYFVENRAAYRHLLIKLIGVGLILGLSGVLIVAVAGRTILALVFRPQYAAYHQLFIWLMVQAAISYIASFLGYGMTAARRFAIQVPLFSIVAGATVLVAWWLIPRWGLTGAAIALIVGVTVQLLVSAWVVVRSLASTVSAVDY